MGDFAVPEEIRKLKPDGSIVKRLHDKYYVYEWTGK
jgi:biotin operon repressor